MGKLDGKVVLISGTGGGQGRAAALRFAKEGARVYGCDISVPEADETVRLVAAEGGEMRSMAPLDVSNLGEAKRWAQAAVDAWGGIDVVYNNAGGLGGGFGNFPESDTEAWDFTIQHELTIVYVGALAGWSHLVKRGGGVIINTSSQSAHRATPPLLSVPHCAAKAGILGLTRALAAEGRGHKIRVVTLTPGVIRLEPSDRLPINLWSDETPEGIARATAVRAKLPFGRPGECDEIASIAVFLASDDASYINGSEVVADGGILSMSI